MPEDIEKRRARQRDFARRKRASLGHPPLPPPGPRFHHQPAVAGLRRHARREAAETGEDLYDIYERWDILIRWDHKHFVGERALQRALARDERLRQIAERAYRQREREIEDELPDDELTVQERINRRRRRTYAAQSQTQA